MSRYEIKERAKAQLGNNIFGQPWMMALVVCLIMGAINLVLGAIPSVGSVATLIITGPLSYGVCAVFLKQTRDGEVMNVGDMFCGFKDHFGETLLIGLMTAIYTFLWALLFLIPGIVKSYSYSMAYYIKADHPEYSWSQCIAESRKLTEGHKWDLFVLDLSFIGWYLVGSICIVGSLWVTPYHNAAKAQFYESIKPAVVEETPVEATVAE